MLLQPAPQTLSHRMEMTRGLQTMSRLISAPDRNETGAGQDASASYSALPKGGRESYRGSLESFAPAPKRNWHRCLLYFDPDQHEMRSI